MTTLEIEVRMMEALNIRENLIVPNVRHGMQICNRCLHECDLLVLSASGFATEIEIKVDKSDLVEDQRKRHKHIHPGISRLYFAVPAYLKEVALECIPERAGLYILYDDDETSVVLERTAKRSNPAIRWTDGDRLQLARLGAMRILKLKKKLLEALNYKRSMDDA